MNVTCLRTLTMNGETTDASETFTLSNQGGYASLAVFQKQARARWHGHSSSVELLPDGARVILSRPLVMAFDDGTRITEYERTLTWGATPQPEVKL